MHLFLDKLAKPVAFLLLGACVGLTAWNQYAIPIVAVLIPMLMPLAKNKLNVFLLAYGYHSATVRGLIEFSATWFNDSILMGIGAWCALSVLSASVWTLCYWPNKKSPIASTALCVALAFILSLLPPFSSILPGHPLVAWGFITTGAGFVGIAIAVVATFLGALSVGAYGERHKAGIGAVVLIVGASGFLLKDSVLEKISKLGTQNLEIVGVDTYYGKPPFNDYEKSLRVSEVGNDFLLKVRDTADSVFVFPETSLGRLDEAFEFSIQTNIASVSEMTRKAIVVGVEGVEGGKLRNMAVAYLPDGERVVVYQRQPAVLSMWRPWDKNNHFQTSIFSNQTLDLGKWGRARVMICYEEFIPLLYILDELRGGHQVTLSMTNNWSAGDDEFPHVQRMHAMGMYGLFNREFIRAVNYSQ